MSDPFPPVRSAEEAICFIADEMTSHRKASVAVHARLFREYVVQASMFWKHDCPWLIIWIRGDWAYCCATTQRVRAAALETWAEYADHVMGWNGIPRLIIARANLRKRRAA